MEQEELRLEEEYEVDESPRPSEHVGGIEEQSKSMLGKVKKALKFIKWIVIAAGIIAGVLLIYGILAITVMSNADTALIGFIVILAVEGVLFVTFGGMLVYTKIMLNKIKKAE